jgi:hypothetical protein
MVYLLLALSILFGTSAWFAEEPERAGVMVLLATLTTFRFGFAYFAFYLL